MLRFPENPVRPPLQESNPDPDETLVSDARADMTPADMVQEKLRTLLWGRSGSAPAPRLARDFRRVPE